MMNADLELETWRQQWQSVSTVPADLSSRVLQKQRFLRAALVGDALVTVGIGGATLGWAVRSSRPDVILLAVGTWMLIGVAWAFRLRTTRGNWAPASLGTEAYVDFLIARCRSQLSAIRFGAVLFAVNLSFSLGWVYHQPGQHAGLFSWPMDIVWAAAVAFYCFLPWWNRRKKAELAWLMGMRDQL